MKKPLSFILISTLILSISTGCTAKNSDANNIDESKPLKDGIYITQGETSQNGWTPEITITVNSGKLTAVKYDETAAMRKSEDIEYLRSFKAQNNIDLAVVYQELQTSLINKQDPSKIDAVAGATTASNSFKALSEEALALAKEGDKLKDGAYSVAGKRDEKNWTPTIAITIEEGKISTVKYDEISGNIYKNKSKDMTYLARLNELKQIDLLQAYETLQSSLIEKQDPSKVDAYTGATAASNQFKELARKAMNEARK